MGDEAVRPAYLALLRGEVSGVDALVAALGTSAAAGDRGWALALRAARWHAEPDTNAMPSIAECEALLGDDRAIAPLAIAAHHAARARSLALEDAEPWLELLRRIGPAATETRLATAFARVLREGAGDIDELLPSDADLGARFDGATLALEATAIRALASELSGDRRAALEHARLASRVSRTERIPQQQYFANVVLARLRRLHGLPHLAARILSALARVAPRQWSAWLAWELALAGALEAAQAIGAPGPVSALFRFLDSARAGQPEAIEHRAAELRAAADWRPFADDVETLLACTGLDVPIGEAADWVFGEADVPPRGLWGLSAALRPEEHGETALAVVIAAPGRRARRVLWSGVPRAARALEIASLRQTKRKQGRMDSTIATLCLAQEDGLDDADLFHRVYRLRYAPHLHRGVLDVLLHRVRERIEGLGRLERGDGRTSMRVDRAILVPDPRCGRPIDDRILYLLATLGHTSARDAAKALSVPLRTAQAALQALVDDGSCVRERRGNSVEYGVEDTTFSEPTRY